MRKLLVFWIFGLAGIMSAATHAQVPSAVVDLSALVDNGTQLGLTWNRPVEREDNSALPANEIGMYVLWCSNTSNITIPDTDTAEYASTVNGLLGLSSFQMNQPFSIENDTESVTFISGSRTAHTVGEVPQAGGFLGCQLATVDTDGLTSVWTENVESPKYSMPVRPAAPSGFGANTGT